MRNYMKNPGNELDKARLTKLVLSNPTLKDGTIDYDYGKLFDVLINLTSQNSMVEVAGVEPASARAPQKGPTFLVLVQFCC